MNKVNEMFNISLKTYVDLYEWSVASPSAFWSLVWDETNLIGEKGYTVSNPYTHVPMLFTNRGSEIDRR